MIQGEYEIHVKSVETGEKQVYKQPNLITDFGLNYFSGQAKTISMKNNMTINSAMAMLEHHIQPDPNLSEVVLPYRTDRRQEHLNDKYFSQSMSDEFYRYPVDDGITYAVESDLVFNFGLGKLKGNIQGFAIGCREYANPQSGVTQLKQDNPLSYPWTNDPNGTDNVVDHYFTVFSIIKLDRPIVVDETHEVYIFYRLRRYLPKYTRPQKTAVTVDGVQHTITIKPLQNNPNFLVDPGAKDTQNYRSPWNTFSIVDINSIISAKGPTGKVYGYPDQPVQFDWRRPGGQWKFSTRPYKMNSYEMIVDYSLGIYGGNDLEGIAQIEIYNPKFPIVATFDPPFPKNDTRSFEFSVSCKWGRAEEADPLIPVNLNVSATDFVLTGASKIVDGRIHIPAIVRNPEQNSATYTYDVDRLNVKDHALVLDFEEVSGAFGDHRSYTRLDLKFLKDTGEVLYELMPDLRIINGEAIFRMDIPDSAVTTQKIVFSAKTGSDNYQNPANFKLTKLRLVENKPRTL